MSLNLTKSTQTCQAKSKKTLCTSVKTQTVNNKALISIGISIILYGKCYKRQDTIAKEAGTTRQNICEFTSNHPLITKTNRGANNSCLYDLPEEYTNVYSLANHNGDVVKKTLLGVWMSKVFDTDILIDVTKNLGIRARSFFAKFSDRALNDSYIGMMRISGCNIGYFTNIAGYLYTACMKYHKDYEIPLLY